MRLKKRIQNLGKNIVQKKEIPGVALKFLSGEIDWNGQIFLTENEFDNAVDIAFKDEPPSPWPRVIIINFRRKMENIRPSK